MFENLKNNLDHASTIVSDIQKLESRMNVDKKNELFYIDSINSLKEQLKIINNTIPSLLKEWSPLTKYSTEPKEEVVKMSYISPSSKEKKYITLNNSDKKKFLESLKLTEDSFKSIKGDNTKDNRDKDYQTSFFAKASNRLFRNTSEKLVKKLPKIEQDLKMGNVQILVSTYISMAIFSTILSFLFGIIIYLTLILLDSKYITFFWIPLTTTVLCIFLFYMYPSGEANSIQKKISQELPFATIHMAAIAGSNMEPTKIFKIIALSKEYPSIGKEIRKIVNQTEIYGYDLVTALKNVAGRTSNKQLADLLNGLATNINTGGELKSYLEKKAENFLLDYKLERQKFSDLAGTFMDVYISILIAAPLILMMMFIVMNLSGSAVGGLGIDALMYISIGGIIIANIIFLVVLNMKQPTV